METMGAQANLGVALVRDLPEEMTDLDILLFFNEIKGISSVTVTTDGNLPFAGRCCWLEMENPQLIINDLRETSIKGKHITVNLMGYKYYENLFS